MDRAINTYSVNVRGGSESVTKRAEIVKLVLKFCAKTRQSHAAQQALLGLLREVALVNPLQSEIPKHRRPYAEHLDSHLGIERLFYCRAGDACRLFYKRRKDPCLTIGCPDPGSDKVAFTRVKSLPYLATLAKRAIDTSCLIPVSSAGQGRYTLHKYEIDLFLWSDGAKKRLRDRLGIFVTIVGVVALPRHLRFLPRFLFLPAIHSDYSAPNFSKILSDFKNTVNDIYFGREKIELELGGARGRANVRFRLRKVHADRDAITELILGGTMGVFVKTLIVNRLLTDFSYIFGYTLDIYIYILWWEIGRAHV